MGGGLPVHERIPEYVAIAFRHALAAPRGPVYLELPMDVLFAEAEPDHAVPGGRASAAAASGDPHELERAAELLGSRSGPAIIAGSGVWWDGAAPALAAFAEHGALPVFLNGSGRGSLPPDHPLLFQHAREHGARRGRRRLRHRGARSTSASATGGSEQPS